VERHSEVSRTRTSVPDVVVVAARRQADEAAATAGIRLVEARTPEQMRQVRALFDDVWQADPTNPAVTVELLLAYAHTGQYVVLAHDLAHLGPAAGAEVPVAASVGFLGAPVGRALHSNITGVRPAGLGRSLGWAVKLHQRAWALAAGLDLVTWTYDPLIRRNAWFNLGKLAARPVAYEVDFYGPMLDARNGGDESDRLYVRWSLDHPAVLAAAAGAAPSLDVDALRSSGFRELVAADADGGGPRRPAGAGVGTGAEGRDGAPGLLVQVPADIEALREQRPDLALRWRHAVREAMQPAIAAGWVVTGFSRDGWYVLEMGDRT
jgi:predicted GNAT superfamily acetyltransferase